MLLKRTWAHCKKNFMGKSACKINYRRSACVYWDHSRCQINLYTAYPV